MENIEVKKLIFLVEKNECIWKNSTINGGKLCEIEAAWLCIALKIYRNFNDFNENQKKFWGNILSKKYLVSYTLHFKNLVNNLKRKWKTVINNLKTIGINYEHFKQLQFLVKKSSVVTYKNDKTFNANLKANLNCPIKLNANNKAVKCGEILYENYKYFYKCAICDSSFDLLEFFEGHMSKKHPLALLKEMETGNFNSEKAEYLLQEDCDPNLKQEHLEKYLTQFSDESRLKAGESITKNVFQLEERKSDKSNQVNFAESDLNYGNPADESCYEQTENLYPIECQHCSVLFQSSNEHDFDYCFQIQKMIFRLNGDLRALRDEGIFHCDRCPRYFNSADEMYNHRRKEHYEICPVCKIRLLNIENHVISHHNEINFNQLKIPDSFSSGNFECKFCNKILVHKDLWLRHISRCLHTEIVENKPKIMKLI